MGYIQGADRNQVVLLPETLDDYVGMENEVRVIDAFIDGLDIKTMGFKAEAAREGRPGYDPRDMLKLYMYQICETDRCFGGKEHRPLGCYRHFILAKNSRCMLSEAPTDSV